MNINSLNAPPARSTGVGGRIDIRSEAPAPAHNTPTALQQPETGLSRILAPAERQALVEAFGLPDGPAYSGRGTTVSKPAVLGSQLDLQA